MNIRTTLCRLTMGSLTLGVAALSPAAQPATAPAGAPATECVARVAYELAPELAGYFVADAEGRVCVPFSTAGRVAPPDYRGDYFAREFTDAKIKAKYAACRADAACRTKLAGIAPLSAVPHEFRVTGTVDTFGKIDPHGGVDLRQIRRPNYFGKQPWAEPIAEADARTWTIEFQAPREAWERLHMHRTDSVALRGWYLQGTGIADANGKQIRALVVLLSGRSVETTASDAPGSSPSEKPGARGWRNLVYAFNRAGFDVLTFDKRGHGISGGYDDVNTLEQGRDMWRGLDALETGTGVRALSPDGQLLEGAAVRGKFLAGMSAKRIPVLFGGSSQGSIATAWAMEQTFVVDCGYDLPDVRCSPAHRYNVKGALLLATVATGIGGRPEPVDVESGVLDEARSRVELNTVMLPGSEPLSHMDRWPAVFIAKGLWDFAESLEASLDSYRRVKGLREMVVLRGPHSTIEMDPASNDHVAARMIAFSRAAILGLREVPGAARFDDLKSLVGTSPTLTTGRTSKPE